MGPRCRWTMSHHLSRPIRPFSASPASQTWEPGNLARLVNLDSRTAAPLHVSGGFSASPFHILGRLRTTVYASRMSCRFGLVLVFAAADRTSSRE